MLGFQKGREICRYVPDYVIYDLETTGISPARDGVIEISALKVRGGKVVSEFSQLVNPGMHISEGASRVNNIYDDMVADAPLIEEVLPLFIAFVGNDVLAGHNIRKFDMQFLYRDCDRYFGQPLANDFIDTLSLAKKCFPNWPHRRLADLANHYGISTVGAHRALRDCHINHQVFELMGRDLAAVRPEVKAGSELLGSDGNPVKLCPECHSPMRKRQGRFGEFWGCTGYPSCRHTENIR